MGRKTLRSLVMSGVLVAGVGLAGASGASALNADGVHSSRSVSVGGTNDGPYKTVTVNGLRVRTGPGTNRVILGLVYRGQRVRAIAVRRDHHGQRWDKVKLVKASRGGLPRGFTGWVTEMYLY